MASDRAGASRSTVDLKALYRTAVLLCLVATLCYLAAKLGGVLALRPQMIWPLWPGCALLVAVMLLVRRGIWPLLIAAGFAGFVLSDLQIGLTIRSTALLILADTIEVLIAAFGVSCSFEGVPRLNSVKSVAKYAFFAVFLAPVSAAFVGAAALGGGYWIRWRISFFTEALAFLTLTPAILSWFSGLPEWAQKSRAYYFEAAVMMAGLFSLAYIAFVGSGPSNQPVLVYSLVPFLLWAALRFGWIGISTSMIGVALLSIWGAVDGRGPFAGPQPLNGVLSLQLFLFVTAIPFMVLAALIEERRRADGTLRESEQRFRLIANTAPVMIWMSGPDKLCEYFNQPWLEFTGQPLVSQLGNGWTSGIHPEDLATCLNTYTGAFDQRLSFKMQYRLRRHDGEYRWIFDIGVPRFSGDGSFVGYIGACTDITERKLAEEALSRVGQRLIQAQEEERSRIARELHDDVNQSIALLGIELEELKQNLPVSALALRHGIQAVQDRILHTGKDIRAISHRLHSPKLEYLGIAAAAGSFCRELSEQWKVEISFSHADIPPDVPREISLCLFRVLQEALQNAVKHSGTCQFKAELRGSPHEIHLIVSDAGVGFDPQVAWRGPGLGLVSMRERLQLVKGEISITSQPNCGTTVRAWVPLRSGDHSLRTAG